MHRGWLVLLLAGGLTLAGCGATVSGTAVVDRVPDADRTLVDTYVAAFNRAGEQGPRQQAAFLRETQEPGVPVPPDPCDGTTARTRPVERTLRPAAPDWRPVTPVGPRPRPPGAAYVMAVSVSLLAGGVPVAEDVRSDFLVIRDGRVYGYAMCRVG